MHSGKVILITGGTGQVGTAAAAALLRRGWKVRVLTRDSSSAKDDALRTMGARMSSAAILTTGKACIGRWPAFFCVPPLVASFMPAGSFEPPESALADIAPFSSAAAEEKPTEFKADYDDRRVEYHVP